MLKEREMMEKHLRFVTQAHIILIRFIIIVLISLITCSLLIKIK